MDLRGEIGEGKGSKRCLPFFCSHERRRGEGIFFMGTVCFSHLLERDKITLASTFNGKNLPPPFLVKVTLSRYTGEKSCKNSKTP